MKRILIAVSAFIGIAGLNTAFAGADLGDVLRTKDVNASLRALNKTMQYCAECHASYRQ